MYYPFLRAKQYELIALREFAEYVDSNVIVPIIEPVKTVSNSLNLTLSVLSSHGINFGIVMNPQVGELEGLTNQIDEMLNSFSYARVFFVRDNVDEISNYVENNKHLDIYLICDEETKISDSLIRLIKSENVSRVILTEKQKRLRRDITKNVRGKDIVVMYDFFEKKPKNADYVGVEEEFFSEEYWFFDSEGFSGICDYTVLPSLFIEGGRLPAVVVIHLTYVKNESVYIRHFSSSTSVRSGNIQLKFAQAAEQALQFFEELGINTKAVEELREMYQNKHYPGLGFLKKISVLHHLEMVSHIIESR